MSGARDWWTRRPSDSSVIQLNSFRVVRQVSDGDATTRGGHPDRRPEIHPTVPAVVADTDAKAREGAAWFVSFYVTTMGTIYRDSLTRQGCGKAMEAVLLGPNHTREEREAFRLGGSAYLNL